MRVYLAGGIQGVDDPFSWRIWATEWLRVHDMVAVDPLRGKVKEDFDDYNCREIIVRDKADICSCDVVLANIDDLRRPYIGTAMEILFAWERGIPVVVCSEYKSYWLEYHSVAQFSTLCECLEYILEYWS